MEMSSFKFQMTYYYRNEMTLERQLLEAHTQTCLTTTKRGISYRKELYSVQEMKQLIK
jgi:hypothetical protein